LNSEPVSCTWGINNPQLVFEPAIGSTVSELKTITIDFPGADKVEFVSGGYGPDNLPTQNKETRNIYYDYSPLKSEAMSGDENSDDTGFEPVQSGELVPVIDGTTATITMPENYESGIVTFTFRDGAFNVWYNGARVPSKSLLQSAKYTIIKQDADENDNAGYTITPEPGEVYQIPSAPIIDKVGDSETTTEAYFVLYPPKDKTIAMVAKASARLYQVIDGERQSDAIKTFVGKKYNEGNGIMFYIAGESEPGSIKLPAGNYQLVVAANSDYTNRNPELVYNYTFLPSEIEVATIITPSNETTLSDPIEKVTIEFPDAENVTLNSGTYAIVNLGTIEFTAEVALETVNDHQAIVITPSAPFAADGTYVFTISGSDLTVDGMNYPISISYELYTNTTGVNEVESQVAADVYSIDGRIVARNASLEALKALNPGLYIINGKKVLIRK
ncbi:MAG: hypothetical protein K2K29_05710, partial [Muribaculaceae bacterium]|nr:hypothetical protein [Muribaculaceae bacterium]